MDIQGEDIKLNPKEKVVHQTFKPVVLSLLKLTKRCPKLEAIEVSPSQFAKVSERSLCLQEVLKVRIFAGQMQGYRTDMAVLQRAEELQAEGLDSDKIVARVAEEAKISLGMAGFIFMR